jgi:hypothetical protein
MTSCRQFWWALNSVRAGASESQRKQTLFLPEIEAGVRSEDIDRVDNRCPVTRCGRAYVEQAFPIRRPHGIGAAVERIRCMSNSLTPFGRAYGQSAVRVHEGDFKRACKR